MKKVLLILLVFIMGASILAACSNKKDDTSKTEVKQEVSKFETENKKLKNGTVVINKFKDYTIHTYASPEDGALVNTQIIETKNKLIVIDAQFLLPYAKEARDYANSLKKPIERLIISHSHPDHWFGSELFSDTKIYALKEVKDEIEKTGDAKIKSKQAINQAAPLVPTKLTAPTHILEEGNLIIDGLNMVVKKVTETEAEEIAMIEIPQDKVLIAQDVVYNASHIYLAQNETDRNNWIKTLEELKGNNYSLVLGGHGVPTTNKVFSDMIQYIKDGNEIIKKISSENKDNKEKAQEYKNYIIEKYPNYKGKDIVDLTTMFLFV
ncbi:MBL fold metallo-hydrolase [Clostridium estertheticum]|uniref:MBL fold metallo-hydrolase n=1 Tax=Clostridium estertheticum TaxID=238834 RepID=UPI001CF3BBAF|nr:MBL fold metallo-hydrolase [Clostridium estertheticum]MCB2362421.1 MBL fold metallo-hydrolase [Clostridium estertheticum]